MALDVLAVVAALLLGLSAGLFFAFSVAVMPGFRAIGDAAFTAAMNAINRAILNPLFLLVYIGALLLVVAAAIVAFAGGSLPAAWLLTGAALVYLVGVLGVTGAVNIPLNNALAADSDRAAFESRWVRFNNLRTLAGVVAFTLALVAIGL